MSKILVITPCPTHPTTEGNARRILNLVEALLRLGHDVHVFYLPHFMFSLPDLPAMRERWKERLHIASSPWSWLPGGVRNALLIRHDRILNRFGLFRRGSRDGAAFDRLVYTLWQREAQALCERQGFDVVIVEYVFMSSILCGGSAPVLKIIDTHDVFTDRHKRISPVPARSRWLAATREDEALGLNRAHVVLAIQEEEAAYFRELTPNPVVTVGHLLDRIRPAAEPGGPPSALTIASRNAINRHGLSVFLDQCWPLIRNAVPEARFRLVGTAGEVLAGEWPGVERLGVIADPDRAYAQGQIVINPVLEGTGLPIKSIEALASGKPLVTTPSGARGIEDGAGSAFLVGATPADFAGVVVRLFRDPRARETLAAAAIQYAKAWNERQMQKLQNAVGLPIAAIKSGTATQKPPGA